MSRLAGDVLVGNQEQPEVPVLVSCTSWSGPGRLCRYVWDDGTVEWFTEKEVHRKGLGRAVRPEGTETA